MAILNPLMTLLPNYVFQLDSSSEWGNPRSPPVMQGSLSETLPDHTGPNPVGTDAALFAEFYGLRTCPMRGGCTGAATP